MPEWTRDPVPTSQTSIHVRLHDLLVDIGFDVEDEVQVGPYALDCYVRDWHLGFEADGTIWHSAPKQRGKDEERDTFLAVEAGIPVMRVEEDAFRDLEALTKRVERFIDKHADTAAERRARCEARFGDI